MVENSRIPEAPKSIEVDRLRTELARLRPVVDAARAALLRLQDAVAALDSPATPTPAVEPGEAVTAPIDYHLELARDAMSVEAVDQVWFAAVAAGEAGDALLEVCRKTKARLRRTKG